MKINLHKKSNWLTLLMVCFSNGLFAQSVDNLFVKMPDNLEPTLSSQNRLELIEYYKAHQGDTILNRFGKRATLKVMDLLNQHLIIQNTPNSTFELKVNHLANSSPYIGIIRTICAPICHSTVEFYDTAWNTLPLQFRMPKAFEWIDSKQFSSGSNDSTWTKKVLDISFITLTFSNGNNVITAKNNTLDFLNAEDRKVLYKIVEVKDFVFKLKNKTWTREQ